jgi:cell division protease FtsH
MVCEFGMSDRLGLVTLHRKGEESNFFSELTAADVDAEIKALTDAAYRQAYDVCSQRKETLIRISEHLKQVETIDGEELDRLLALDEERGLLPLAESENGSAARIAAAEADGWTSEADESAGATAGAGTVEEEPSVAAG